jgi:hypothetical protein
MKEEANEENNKNNKNKIFFIIGRAGSGKTEKILELLRTNEIDYCLCPTHSSINNIKSRLNKYHDDETLLDKIDTFHHFFTNGRNLDSIRMLGSIKKFNSLAIEEYTLIDRDLLDKVITMFTNITLYLVGDICQMPPPQNKIRLGLSDYVFNDDTVCPNISTAYHFLRLILPGKPEEILYNLTFNHRAKNDELLYNINYPTFDYWNSQCSKIEDIILDKEYTFLSAKYNVLGKIYNIKFNQIIKEISSPIIFNVENHNYMNKTKFFKGQRVYIVAYAKGDTDGLKRTDKNEYTLTNIYGDDAILDNEIICSIHQIIPIGFYSFHKAQGLSYNKVAICIDDIWENTMIYTAITRARNKATLFSLDTDNKDKILKFLIDRWNNFTDFADKFISKILENK